MALIIKLALGSNKVLGYAYAYQMVDFERHKLSKDGLNNFQLIVMPRISP